MLRTRAPGVSLWEAVLPEEVLRLPEELARVDALLDDPVFFAPLVPFFDPRVGRPSTPMAVYLRLMFLKFRYRLGYETLCREVADSVTWRRFCRIPIDGRVPHPTTLMKLTTRCGTAAVEGCNEALLAKAARRALRRAQVKAAELAATGGSDPAAGRRWGRLRRAVNDLTELLEATRRIAAQTRQRLSGTTPPGATRRVSLRDPDARPIAKGRLGRPVEFGYKGQVLDNDDGVVLDHTVERGNLADAPQPAPAVGRVIRRTRRRPRTVTADRGYGEAAVENDLHDLGVRTVVIPRKGRPGKARQGHEHRRAFRRTVKWRTGSEARISTLKRQYGWDRTRLDDLEGARTWAGQGGLAHNLVKIAAIAG